MTPTDAADDPLYDASPTVLLIGDRADALAAGRRAIAEGRLRWVGTASLADAAAQIAVRSGPDVLLVEAGGIAAVRGDGWLDGIATLARERDIDVVVACDEADVDAVAAALHGPHVQHLCDPRVVDRVAALGIVSGRRDARLHDSVRDTDERLRRLNAEVARFAETLARLSGDGDRPRFGGQVRDPSPGFRHEVVEAPMRIDAALVRDTIRARRMRATHFAEGLFADPAWDMLLDLFAADLEGRRVSVSSLCIAAAVPGTTALRWIGSMVEAGLFERYADPADRRRAFLSLSLTARTGMERYFDAVRRAGLMPA